MSGLGVTTMHECVRLAVDWPPDAYDMPAGSSVQVRACCVECGRVATGQIRALHDDPARALWDVGVVILSPDAQTWAHWERTQVAARMAAA